MAAADTVVADTRRWLERAVIGLNLCPFAKAVLVRQQVHFAVSEADAAPGILQDFERELQELVARDAAERDTTLLAIPRAMADFLDFNDLVGRAERLLRKRRLEGVVQLASFHPRFVFAGTQEDDITNSTNRSPYPTLHLLREASIDRAVAAFPDPAAIYETNMETLRRLGPDGWAALGVGSSE
jgi:hypothetical protein